MSKIEKGLNISAGTGENRVKHLYSFCKLLCKLF